MFHNVHCIKGTDPSNVSAHTGACSISVQSRMLHYTCTVTAIHFAHLLGTVHELPTPRRCASAKPLATTTCSHKASSGTVSTVMCCCFLLKGKDEEACSCATHCPVAVLRRRSWTGAHGPVMTHLHKCVLLGATCCTIHGRNTVDSLVTCTACERH